MYFFFQSYGSPFLIIYIYFFCINSSAISFLGAYIWSFLYGCFRGATPFYLVQRIWWLLAVICQGQCGECDFNGGAGVTSTSKQSIQKKGINRVEENSLKGEHGDNLVDLEDNITNSIKTTPVRHSERSAGKRFKYYPLHISLLCKYYLIINKAENNRISCRIIFCINCLISSAIHAMIGRILCCMTIIIDTCLTLNLWF